MKEYVNRYGDKFTFEMNKRGNIDWKGSFEHVRIGYPNVYKIAYQQFRKDGGQLNQHEFEEKVHEQIYDQDGNWLRKGPITEDYGPMVFSDTDSINMVDPSGGPYIVEGMDMKLFGMKGKVNGFINRDYGYEIITNK